MAAGTPLIAWLGIWFAVLPLASVPLWQVEHWFATGCWVWFQREGCQAVVVWQAMQFAVVGMCTAGLPLALLPLWQLAQTVAVVKVLWFGLVVDCQLAVELWQFSQLPVTPVCVAVLGLAVCP